MVQTTAPMANTSPSLAMVFKVPAFSAVSSKVALSDSSSAIASSMATASPSFFIQRDSVTSVIDSPTVGTLTSNIPVAASALIGATTGADALAAITGCATVVTSLTGDAATPLVSILATIAPIGNTSPS